MYVNSELWPLTYDIWYKRIDVFTIAAVQVIWTDCILTSSYFDENVESLKTIYIKMGVYILAFYSTYIYILSSCKLYINFFTKFGITQRLLLFILSKCKATYITKKCINEHNISWSSDFNLP